MLYAVQAFKLEKFILDKEVDFVNTEVHSKVDGSTVFEFESLICMSVCAVMSFKGWLSLGCI